MLASETLQQSSSLPLKGSSWEPLVSLNPSTSSRGTGRGEATLVPSPHSLRGCHLSCGRRPPTSPELLGQNQRKHASLLLK